MKNINSFVFERNFLILLIGVFINGIGSGVYMIAGMLLVLQLSGSVLYSGFAVFAISLANMLAFLIAPLANYATYKKSLVYSNLIQSFALLSIPILHYTVGLNVWYVIVLLFITSLFTQYTYPIESTILPIIVGKENVIAANSYLQTIREAMDIVFLASAGIIVAFIGAVPTVLVTAICIFLVSMLYIFFTFEQPSRDREKSASVRSAVRVYMDDLKGGFLYIKQSLIPTMMFSIIFINIAMVIMTTNLPAFSLIKGGGTEAAYGFYMGALSLGIMIGTLITTKIKQIDFGKLIIFSFIGTGILWIGTATLPIYASIPMFTIGAMSIGIINILVFSSIQQQVETEYIGRVVTLLTSTGSLGVPLGALLGGFLGETFSPIIPIIICGVSMIMFSVIWLSTAALRKLPAIDSVQLFKTGNVL